MAPANTQFWIEILNSQGRRVYLKSRDPFVAPGADNIWQLWIEGVTSFWWQGGQNQLEYLATGSASFAYWLLHMAIPLYMRVQRATLIMHAAAVQIGQRGVVLSGGSFSGKSTLARCLIDHGHRFLADDKLGLCTENGTLMCTSSYPYCRNYRAAEDLGERVTDFQPAALEVGGIYILERGDSATPVRIHAKRGVEAFSLLQLNGDIPLSFMRQPEFNRIAAVGRLAPLYTLEIPWSLARTDEVVAALTDHQASLITKSGSGDAQQAN